MPAPGDLPWRGAPGVRTDAIHDLFLRCPVSRELVGIAPGFRVPVQDKEAVVDSNPIGQPTGGHHRIPRPRVCRGPEHMTVHESCWKNVEVERAPAFRIPGTIWQAGTGAKTEGVTHGDGRIVSEPRVDVLA